jgi:hypothetical protein
MGGLGLGPTRFIYIPESVPVLLPGLTPVLASFVVPESVLIVEFVSVLPGVLVFILGLLNVEPEFVVPESTLIPLSTGGGLVPEGVAVPGGV